MKKTSLSIALALIGAGAHAQVDETFAFCDAQGNTLANGSVVNVSELTLDEFGDGEDYMTADLRIKNVSDAVAQYSMTVNIKTMDNGKLKHCFPSVCEFYAEQGIVNRTDFGAMKAGAEKEIQSEWLPTGTGLCTVSYTIQHYSYNTATSSYDYVGAGHTVTVNYCNGVSHIDGVQASCNGKTYNLQGQEVGTGYHGLVILNGKKTIRK